MSEEIVVGSVFPSPDIVACFRVHADEHSLLVRYFSEDKVAILYFPAFEIFKFGAPNDEVIDGHRLHSKGLKLYEAQTVINSKWIAELEKQNSVHSRHDKAWFLEGLAHYVFTGQDRTFECVVSEKRRNTEVRLVDRTEEEDVWGQYLAQMD